MDPLSYYQSLKTRKNQQAYAERAGSSRHYLAQKMFLTTGNKNTPQKALLIGLVIGSEGKISLEEALDYFYNDPARKYYKETLYLRDHYHQTLKDSDSVTKHNEPDNNKLHQEKLSLS